MAVNFVTHNLDNSAKRTALRLVSDLIKLGGYQFANHLFISPAFVARFASPGVYEVHTGVSPIKFAIIPGEDVVHSDGRVHRKDMEGFVTKNGWRNPDLVETVLSPAMDSRMGCRSRQCVFFLAGTLQVIYLCGDGPSSVRELHLHTRVKWLPTTDFLFVCP